MNCYTVFLGNQVVIEVKAYELAAELHKKGINLSVVVEKAGLRLIGPVKPYEIEIIKRTLQVDWDHYYDESRKHHYFDNSPYVFNINIIADSVDGFEPYNLGRDLD